MSFVLQTQLKVLKTMNAIRMIIFCAVSSTYCCSKLKQCHDPIIKPEAEKVDPKIRPITLDRWSRKFKTVARRRMIKNKQRLGPRFYFWEKYGMRSMHKTAIFNTLVDFWIFLLTKVFLLMNFSYFFRINLILNISYSFFVHTILIYSMSVGDKVSRYSI